MVSDFLKGIKKLSNKPSAITEGETDKMEDSQPVPVITLPEMDEKQKEELCNQIEILRQEYKTLAEKLYEGQDVIDDHFISHISSFIKIYNAIKEICGTGDGLPVQELEHRPSLEWIRHILYPDDYPHPDKKPDDDPNPRP